MNPLAQQFRIGPDQFAVLFDTHHGIEAGDLGSFLKQAATLAKRQGVELRVVRFEPGSLATIFEAIKNTKVSKAAQKEFIKAPIDGTLKATGIVGAVAAAMIWAFNVDESGPTPIAKAGACVVEEQQVYNIILVTQDDIVPLMDEESARRVRELERRSKHRTERLASPRYELIADRARGGTLEGEVLDIRGEPHFRPDGFRFLVPIDMYNSHFDERLVPDTHFKVAGDLVMVGGRPDSLVIHSLQKL